MKTGRFVSSQRNKLVSPRIYRLPFSLGTGLRSQRLGGGRLETKAITRHGTRHYRLLGAARFPVLPLSPFFETPPFILRCFRFRTIDTKPKVSLFLSLSRSLKCQSSLEGTGPPTPPPSSRSRRPRP